MFGVLVTFASFLSIGIGIYVFSNADCIVKWNGDIAKLHLKEALLMGATLSSSDVIAAVTLINET